MLNNIKAKLFRLWEMSWADLTWLKAWAAFSNFDLENINSLSAKFAVATDADGGTLCITPIEQVYLVRCFAVRRNVSPEEACFAGDIMDAEIARQAEMNGISRLIIEVPACHPSLPDEKWIRIVERKIPQSIATGGAGYNSSTAAMKFIN
jgi:hypothetical protein